MNANKLSYKFSTLCLYKQPPEMNDKKKVSKIQLVINDYLQKDTNYALMLTAHWGAGKTHFLKNVVFKNFEHGYKGAWVSLYGINHIDDVKTRIFFALYPQINNKLVQRTAGLFKLLAKSADIGGFFNLSNTVDEFEHAAKKYSLDLIDLKKLVLCFDDIERVNPDILSINEVLGYINSLVEDQNLKVILIANEDKIGNEKFREIKEKVIGTTLHFTQDFDDAFESILGQINDPTNAYTQDLKKHKQFIKEFLSIEGINYRTLKYFIAYFEPIAYSLRVMQIPVLNPYRETLLSMVIRFVLMICIEFKRGKINFLDDKGLSGYIIIDPTWKMRLKEGAPKEYKQEIVNAYFKEAKSYYFYQSLFEYITGGNAFVEDNFYREIKKQYHVIDQDISPAYQCLNALSYQNFALLSDQDYLLLLRDIRKHLNKGEYQSYEFLTIFDYLTRFGNPLRLDKEKLKNEMIGVLNRYQSNYLYDSKIPMYLTFDLKMDNAPYYSELKKVIVRINNQAKVHKEKKVNETTSDLYFSDLDSCYQLIENNTGTMKEKYTLSYISPKKFFSRFLKADNRSKEKINLLINITYHHSQGNNEDQDVKFLQELKEIIHQRIDNKVLPNVSGWLTSQLLEFVNDRLKSIIASRPF